MNNKSKSLLLAVFGFIFLVIEAVDYLSGSKDIKGLSIIGIMLVIIGMALSRKK